MTNKECKICGDTKPIDSESNVCEECAGFIKLANEGVNIMEITYETVEPSNHNDIVKEWDTEEEALEYAKDNPWIWVYKKVRIK